MPHIRCHSMSSTDCSVFFQSFPPLSKNGSIAVYGWAAGSERHQAVNGSWFLPGKQPGEPFYNKLPQSTNLIPLAHRDRFDDIDVSGANCDCRRVLWSLSCYYYVINIDVTTVSLFPWGLNSTEECLWLLIFYWFTFSVWNFTMRSRWPRPGHKLGQHITRKISQSWLPPVYR